MKNKDNKPDLILIDGGKGQYSVSRETLNDLGLHELPIIAIAADYLAKYGLEYLLSRIYEEKINNQDISEEEVVNEINELKFISEEIKSVADINIVMYFLKFILIKVYTENY